ncbi:phosphoribosyltransferase [bacterium]|nr:phosphoribosyltransferase [bacterium]
MNSSDIKKEIEGLFSQKVLNGLRSFSRALSLENPDIVVLIARKAVCLFDLFDYLGIDKPKAELVSDTILDLNPKYLHGKRVVVVDDTLILGSTLKKIKEHLDELNIKNKIFVFCADKVHWSKELLIPDYIEEYMNPQQVLSFCMSEVKAFSMISRPYIIDYPITNFSEINDVRLEKLKELCEISVIPISLSDSSGMVALYTVFLKSALKKSFYDNIGSGFSGIVDVIKVRLYVSNYGEKCRVRLLPIVMLSPMKAEEIEKIFRFIISSYDNNSIFDEYIYSHSLMLRFIQYYLSVKLGEMFIKYIEKELDISLDLHFKSTEIINLLGKLVGKEFESFIHKTDCRPFELVGCVEKINDQKHFNDIFSQVSPDANNVLFSFQSIFANMYKTKELPARSDVCCGQYDSKRLKRLSEGVSFGAIAEFFSEKLNVENTIERRELFSLCIDSCNDLGISIPIICRDGDVIYRAFRHGELGLRSESTVFLLHSYIKNFFESSMLDIEDGLPSVLLEKLLVMFFRVGVGKECIDITYDYSNPNAINMGFYLMGAVMVNNGLEYFPGSRSDWFSSVCCNDIFHYSDGDKRYHLNRDYDESIQDVIPFKNDGDLHMQLLGRIMGVVYNAGAEVNNNDIIGFNATKKHPPIDINSLVILSSCYSSADLLMALTVELNIIKEWIRVASSLSKQSIANNPYFKDFKSSIVVAAFNQALFKFEYSISDEYSASKIIENISSYLNDVDRTLVINWKNYSKSLSLGDANIFMKKNKGRVISEIYDVFNEITYLGNWIYYIRYLLEYNRFDVNPYISLENEFEFKDMSDGKVYCRKIVKKYVDDESIEHGYEIGYLTTPGKIFKDRERDGVVSFKYRGKKYELKIIRVGKECVPHKVAKIIEGFYQYNDRVRFLSKKMENIANIKIPDNFIKIDEIIKKDEVCDNKDFNQLLSGVIDLLKYDLPRIEQVVRKNKSIYDQQRRSNSSSLFFE